MTILLNPGPDGLAAALQRVAWLLLVVLLWWRARAPGSRLRPPWLALWIAAPLLVNVSYSLAQAAGVGVLEATRAAFGGAHGRLVGTVGNPSENGWYLALATCLLWGWARRDPRLRARPWIAWALAAMSLGALAVIVCAGARAAALALAVAGLCWLLRPGRRRSLRGLLGLGLAGSALAWGLARGGAAALAGRGYLAQLGARMLAGGARAAQGPRAYARDVAGPRRRCCASGPRSRAGTRRSSTRTATGLELLLEYGAPVVLAIAALIVALLREPARATTTTRAAPRARGRGPADAARLPAV
ncbi:MAG: hypothetical protein H6713_24445 [Myxococcales bacterium]|nr:hypothetical protein [Myxococcales bacterium]